MEAEQFSTKQPIEASGRLETTGLLSRCVKAREPGLQHLWRFSRDTSTTKINQGRFHNVIFLQWETQQAGLFYLAFSRDKK